MEGIISSIIRLKLSNHLYQHELTSNKKDQISKYKRISNTVAFRLFPQVSFFFSPLISLWVSSLVGSPRKVVCAPNQCTSKNSPFRKAFSPAHNHIFTMGTFHRSMSLVYVPRLITNAFQPLTKTTRETSWCPSMTSTTRTLTKCNRRESL